MMLTAKKHKGIAALVVLGAIALGGGVSAVVNRADERSGQALDQSDIAVAIAKANRQGQIRACKASLREGGVRRIVADEIQDRIEQAKSITAKDLPSIPPARFKRLVQTAQQARRLRRYQLLHVNCNTVPATPIPPRSDRLRP